MWNDLWAGDRNLYPPEVELDPHASHGQSESQSAFGGLGFPHCAGRYHVSDGF